MRKIISNTTPIITLLSVSSLDLLKDIYGEIILPKGVFEEIEEGKNKQFYEDLTKFNWIKIVDISDKEPIKYLQDLDKGKAEVIVLANEINADLVIIDENIGRNYAKYFDLKLTGTIGVLLKAVKLGLVKEIKPLLVQMQENGIWLNNKLISNILKIADEE